MELSQIIPHIEALIFASDKPLTSPEITELVNQALGFIDDRADAEQVLTAIEAIKEKYDTEFYAFELKQSGGGWQFLTKPLYHKTVAVLNGERFLKRLSTAALETLSIIAYKQPITKSEIETIRGVNCDYAVQKLLEKDLVVISGRKEDAVGKPLIYSTSKSFMDYFGINSPDELPKLDEVIMEEYLKATSMNQLGVSQDISDYTEDSEMKVRDETNSESNLVNEETNLGERETENSDIIIDEATNLDEVIHIESTDSEEDSRSETK